MSVYLCRWVNGDVSLVSGRSRSAIDEVLDEVGDLDGVEMIQIKHAAAIHLRLKKKFERCDGITEYLEFEGIDEQSYWELCGAYPILSQALRNEDASEEQVAEAFEQERVRL